jgi:hypothetical protein
MERISTDDSRDTSLVLQHLGAALRLSLETTQTEPLPAEMGLLALRLAFAEVLKNAAELEAQEAEPESLPYGWAETFRRSLELGPYLHTWWRSRYRAAG